MLLRPVVLVDDEPDDLHMLRRLLLKAGVRNPLLGFQRTEEAFSFIAAAYRAGNPTGYPEVVLTDLEMPGLGGIELLRKLSNSDFSRGLRLAVISGNADPVQVKRALTAGALHVFRKFPPGQELADFVLGTMSKV